MFLTQEKHEGIVVKRIGHWLEILAQRKSHTDQYTQ